MSRRKDRARTPGLWVATNEVPRTGGPPFYQRLHQVLDQHGFDAFVEAQCALFYATTIGRRSLTPGTYFRLLLIDYFEGIDSERGIAWRSRSVRYRADTLAKWSLNRAARLRSSPSCVAEAISTVNPGVSPVARRVLWNAGSHGGVESGGVSTRR